MGSGCNREEMCSGCWWDGILGHLNGAVKSEVWTDGAAGLHSQSAYKAGAGRECTAGAHLSPLPQALCSKNSEMRKQSGEGKAAAGREIEGGGEAGVGWCEEKERDKQGVAYHTSRSGAPLRKGNSCLGLSWRRKPVGPPTPVRLLRSV